MENRVQSMTNGTAKPTDATQAEALDELRANLDKALSLLTAAVDQSLKLSNDDAVKRFIAKEWESHANGFLAYVRTRVRQDKRNLLSWLAMINLKL